ncbi:hypothetical protein SEA_WYBORN_58 [Arthrobacter phage Wyborn]|uniref:Uncharacterized protein n=1 Tax=Arthrobacter phage Wyborn TaxID=3059067 RepID=A0AA96GXL5_9CAUD|nr:hypothetical protein SEA_WYBORN_58 [Arthrobacter phage Wyborn]
MTTPAKPKVPCQKCGKLRTTKAKTPAGALCRDCNRPVPKRVSSQEIGRRRSHCLVALAKIERWFDYDRKASML